MQQLATQVHLVTCLSAGNATPGADIACGAARQWPTPYVPSQPPSRSENETDPTKKRQTA